MVDKKLEKYYWIAGTVIVTLIVSIILIFFMIIPLFKSIDKKGQELKENKANLTVLKEKLDKLKVLNDRKAELKDKEAVVNKAIPTKKEVGELFIVLEGLVTDSAGTTDGASESAAAAVPGAVTTPAATQQGESAGASTSSVQLSSSDYGLKVDFPSYANFKTFLDASEKSQRFIHLNNFSVNNGTGSFSVNLNYKAYYRGQPASTVSGGQAK